MASHSVGGSLKFASGHSLGYDEGKAEGNGGKARPSLNLDLKLKQVVSFMLPPFAPL